MARAAKGRGRGTKTEDGEKRGRRGRKPKAVATPAAEGQPAVPVQGEEESVRGNTPGMAGEAEDKADRLPTVFRVIALPGEVWEGVKAKGSAEGGKSTRNVIAEALDSQLPAVVEELRSAGLHGEVRSNKRVRASLDENIIARIKWGSQQTGLPAVEILRLCVQRHVGKRE